MNLAQKALVELFPERHESRRVVLQYNNRFSSYNANAKYTRDEMVFSLSSTWKEVSEEIQQGLIEHLWCKVYRERRASTNQDLYRSFMKNMTKYARLEHQDEYLLGRFDRMNERYFGGLMTRPNLRWGKTALRKLGHYEYASDTILISSVFSQAHNDKGVEELLDFVIYHEMLHKKHQYNHKKLGARHHTKAFREEEALWHDKDAERKLKWFLRKKKLRLALGF